MDRKDFFRSLTSDTPTGTAAKLKELERMVAVEDCKGKMPVLFLGHGIPMLAVEDNEFVEGFRQVGKEIGKPRAILCISAHWETRGTYVTAMESPRTLHANGDFLEDLKGIHYDAPGSPELAKLTKQMVMSTEVGLDEGWGLDHGAWSVIMHMYPDADIPVIQMSLDQFKGPQYHYEIAKDLAPLRRKGVLIIGSGNMVHNLRMIARDKLDEIDYAYDWAEEANDKMKQLILSNQHDALINFSKQGKSFDLAIPSAEHFLPLLYALALQEEDDDITLFNDKALAGSLSMTSVKIGIAA